MPQPQAAGVIVSDEAARIAAGLFIPGDRVLVDSVMAEFMAGDSCVLIRTGTRMNGSRFWVPTRHIFPWSALVPGVAPIWGGGDIPDYNVLDTISRADAPYWDWRAVTKP